MSDSEATRVLKGHLRDGFLQTLRRAGYKGRYPCLRRERDGMIQFVTFQLSPGLGRVRVALYEARHGELLAYDFATVAAGRTPVVLADPALDGPLADWYAYSPSAMGPGVGSWSTPESADRLISAVFALYGERWR